ncbi:hypothetical protein GCM10009765_09170 [Fodinicola feengrottensis]|uniref:Integrase catalytic domain-containing protein n=1 Tax=Fodinicola feengrottensis TaxID=435914 RepID=A0ABN2FY02_9ACTN
MADSMARQNLVARTKKRRKGLTRPDKAARPLPDLLKRDFTASAPNLRWVGDMTEIVTDEGKLYLATAIDLHSRRVLGAATGIHPDAELACAAIRMAVAARGGAVDGVVFTPTTDRRTPRRTTTTTADDTAPVGSGRVVDETDDLTRGTEGLGKPAGRWFRSEDESHSGPLQPAAD